jgi:hypothetical protein
MILAKLDYFRLARAPVKARFVNINVGLLTTRTDFIRIPWTVGWIPSVDGIPSVYPGKVDGWDFGHNWHQINSRPSCS